MESYLLVTVKGKIPHILLFFVYYYIDHYFCKSTEEFINKINKGDVLYNMNYFKERIKVYYYINKVTKEKVDYIKKHVYINISFRKLY